MKYRSLKRRGFSLSNAASVALGIAFLATSLPAQTIQSTFDTDLDGWTQDPAPGPGAKIVWAASDGNPGAYLRRTTGDGAGVSVLVAPSKFLGNRSAWNGGTFQWDGKLISGDVTHTYDDGGSLTQPDYGTIRVEGNGLVARQDIVPGAPPSHWTTFSIPLTASAFGVSELTWSTILSNVTSLKFSIEAIYGLEEEGIDNIVMETGRPELHIASAAPLQATLSWPTNATGFLLETTSPITELSWTTVTNEPTVLGSQFGVTIPATNSSQFFRLRRP